MQKHTTIPTLDGLYWYYEDGADAPRPVLINQAKYQGRFKSFNGSEQRWLRDGEYLLGPVPMPEGKAAAEKFEAIKAEVIALLDGEDIRSYESFDTFYAEMDTATHYEQEDSEQALSEDQSVLEAVYLALCREAEAEQAALLYDFGHQVGDLNPWVSSAADELSCCVECVVDGETVTHTFRVRYALDSSSIVEAVAINQATGKRAGQQRL